ncbi:MAG: hypothetical protein FJ257_08770 [Phycisphaerae bacterium]|nr:hypothetical protein [Phycisphaerae bacterium]
MKGRILGMAVAATLGIASLANAHPIDVGQISPPGTGLPGSSGRLEAAPLAVFSGPGATSGSANNMGGDLATLVAAVNPVAGQVYVFAVESASGASLVVLAGGSVNTSVLTNTGGTGVYQTGGVNISSLMAGGFSSIGTMDAVGGNSSFAYVNMPIYTTGSVTLFGQDGVLGRIGTTATVNFLSWNSISSTFSTVTSQNMDGSLSFQFQVVPVPAPVALAGLGLVGAGLLRRRMAKN